MQLLQKGKFVINFNWRKWLFWLGMFCLFLPALTSAELLKRVLNLRMRDLLSLVCIMCMLICNIKKGQRISLRLFDFLLIGITFFILHNNYYVSLGNTSAAMRYLALFLTVFFLQKRDNWIQPLLNALSIVYIIYAFFTIWCYLDRDFYMSRIVPMFPDMSRRLIEWYNAGCMAGIVEHYSINGILLANGILVHAAGILNPQEHKILNRCALLMCSVAMLLTGKRGPLIFVAFAIFVLYFLYQSNQKNIIKKILQVIGVLIVLVVAVIALYQTVPQLATFVSRFQETASAGDVTLGRSAYWNLALEMFSSNTVLGSGWYRFAEFTIYRLGFTTHAHNIYVQLLAETGVVGTLLFLAWFGSILTISIRFFVKARRGIVVCGKEHVYHMAFSIAMQIFFVTYGLTGNPIYDELTYVPYFISCAIALYYHNRLRESQKKIVFIQKNGLNVSKR